LIPDIAQRPSFCHKKAPAQKKGPSALDFDQTNSLDLGINVLKFDQLERSAFSHLKKHDKAIAETIAASTRLCNYGIHSLLAATQSVKVSSGNKNFREEC
jgi:hypothetical protein